ncbi:hypothetical protein [Eleftheria terrae]|uniref:hypothetical protein n=1 Tax=Eleftheria terrae TaxID=1597781 RepID=UPI00263A853D|nr:hypothetical protein [Eleftheria terrae]WKB54245.1 hypothetical protein N7L95_07605 [Eleftheria terrae]
MKLPACLRRLLGTPAAEGPHSAPPRGEPRVRKAVIPVGQQAVAWPALQALPIEMLPVVDRPLLHYAVTEALAAGIEEILFVLDGPRGPVDEQLDLEVSMLPRGVRAHLLRQGGERGLAHGLLGARHLLRGEAFALLLPTEVTDGEPGVLQQLLRQFERTPCSLVAVEAAAANDPHNVMVETAVSDVRLACVRRLGRGAGIAATQAPAWAAAGRCILTPGVLDTLAQQAERTVLRAADLRDVLGAVLLTQPLFAYRYSGRRFDCRRPTKWLEANLAQALRHPRVAGEFQQILRQSAQFVPAKEDLSQVQARALPCARPPVTGRPRLRLVRN